MRLRNIIIRLILFCIPLAGSAETLSIDVIGADSSPVEGVAVYLEAAGLEVTGPQAQTAALRQRPVDESALHIGQKGRRFAPYLGVIQTGGRVIFNNDDDITHHIYSFNGPARFSFRLRTDESNSSQSFPEAGVIAMGCNVHDWMSGYLLVVDTDLYGTTTSEGNVVFDNVPAGEYRVTGWHPQMREEIPLARTVRVPETDSVVLQLSAQMAPMPQQEGLDDFDFLEDY